jgi:hypothetical protein
MPMFYFHLTEDGDRSADLEGSPFASFELAYLATHQAIQDMWSEMVRRGKDPRTCSFEITDSAATSLAIVPFAEAMDGSLPLIFRSEALGSDPCPDDESPDAVADRRRQLRRSRDRELAAVATRASRYLPYA